MLPVKETRIALNSLLSLDQEKINQFSHVLRDFSPYELNYLLLVIENIPEQIRLELEIRNKKNA